MLGYNPAHTKMVVGQWRLDLVGLDRKLQHDLDEGPQIPSFETAISVQQEFLINKLPAGQVGGAYRPCSPSYENHTGVRGNRYARWL
jgi:hypothetical protein